MCACFDVHAHGFALSSCVCAQIFTKNFLVVRFSVISLSLKLHKDLIFPCGDICNIEEGLLFSPALKFCLDPKFIWTHIFLNTNFLDLKNCKTKKYLIFMQFHVF